MSHITRELFALIVWADLLVVTGTFLYLVSAPRDAGGFRFQLEPDEGGPADETGDRTPDGDKTNPRRR